MKIKGTSSIFIIFYLVIFLGIYNITSASDACMLFPVSLKEKVNNSSLIIEGKVIASNSYWNKTHTLIYTVNQVQIFKIFKGRSVFHTVNIITEGGRVGLEIMEYTSTLTLQAGDEGIFFCETAPLASFNIPVISDLPTYKVYSSIQGFIQYNPDNLSASEPFNTYTDIVNTLYPEIVSATGTGFRIVTANPFFTPPKQTPKSGGNIINAVPTITSFSPSTITAGTRSILTINGTNFGAARGTGFVEFANGNDGGASFVKPKVNDYRVWNNTQIQVWVPDNSLSNGPAAGTGVIRVTNSDPSTVTSASTLTITYSVINVEFNSTGQYTEDRNGNGLGGYTFQFESSIFAVNAPAVAAFTRAMNNWICNTNINWRIGANTAINSASNDGTNVVRFDIGAELPAGVLGRAGSNYSGCFGGGGDTVWSTVDIDVTFNDNPGGLTWQYGPAAPTSSNFDFESVSVHELGHAHHLDHIILSTAVMHYSITNGQSKRVLNATNDIAAGNFVMTKSTAAHGCKPSVMTALTPAASVSITANPGNSICSGTNVTFTATPVNGGDAPSYQWKKNGVNVGSNSTAYADNALANNDQITCVMTSSISCATGNPATSNIILMTVNSSVAASVNISASPAGAICAGTNVTFTALPTNPGTTPVYQWKKGGVNVGTNSTTYSDNTLATGNQITCVMTSNAACVTGSPATSNIITMTVNPNVAASVTIAASPAGAICPGTNVTFTATPTNPGTTPVYQWKKSGLNVGTNSTTYSDNALSTGNQITCVMSSNASCVTGSPATSNIITMTVNPNVAAGVSISASPAGAVCAGTNVTFTAIPTNPGTTPVYQWKKDGVNVGTNTTTYSDNALATGNQITCVMTSNATCVTGSPATSNIITMTVNPNLAASVSISASPAGAVCAGTNVTFTAVPTNPGTTPVYQWKKDGVNVGTNSITYSDNALATGNQITCILTSNAVCVTGSPATSNIITMTVNPNVAASVSIAASPAGAICPGTNVTFTATPTNPGTTPVYQWKKGGVNVGTNSTTYSDNTLATGNQITCVMTSNTACVTGNPATSNIITMTVNPNVAASVSIAASPAGAICSGTNVTFTATPTNPGTTPVYQWKKGGVNVGTNSTTYSDNTLATGNQITCVMTSNAACVTGSPATSNIITMTVNPNVAASVSIAASPAGAICSGTNVTFTATPTNPGTTPVYQWKKGGVNVGTNSTTYFDNALATGNQITCVMTSNAACVTGSPATSNIITMTVNPNLTASVSIAASPAGAICPATNVTFTATPTNPGTTPVYQWKKNGVNVGSNSTSYSDNALANGNQITCVMTSNATCVTVVSVTSNTLTMTVNPLPVINNFTPSSGTVGSTVTINGSGFVNVSSVNFNGTSASFTVNSSIQITATVPSGAASGTISVITACGTATSGVGFTVTPSGVTLTVKLFIEGYYNAGGLMNNGGLGGCLFVNAISPNAVDVDTVFISAMDAVSHVLVSRQSGILKTNGNVIVSFNAPVVAGTSYFIRVQHRNALETWSALPVVFAANTSYDFTTAQNKAFGNTQVQTSDINVWAFYSGDISSSISGLGVQDGIMESQDYGDMENAVYSTLTGYKIQDITGDGVVESADYGIIEGNVYFTIVALHP